MDKNMTGWYITANDIKNWTATSKRNAEETLPLLVKKLILASCNPQRVDFPSGDAVAMGGWDGALEVNEATEFLPTGISGWEFGTNEGVKGKADEEYSKRLKKPDPFKLNETTFVFVTSRLWTKRDEWVRLKESDNKWKNVKGINAGTLASWLETCPAVHQWFAVLLGKRSTSDRDVGQAWSGYRNQTKVNLTSAFLLHNRESECKSIENILTGKPELHRIRSASKTEAYGFILASLVGSDIAKSRSLIIKDQNAWDLIILSKQPLILIPHDLLPSGMGMAVSNGHTVIIATDEKDTHSEAIFLNRLSRLDRQEGFKKLGINDKNIDSLYDDTKGYIEPLLRHPLLQPVDYKPPSWPDKFPLDTLFAVLFASEWSDDNEFDREALETLSSQPYADFNKIITRLSKEIDSPIRLIGNVWQVISKVDFWLLIAPKIAVPYVECLGKSVLTVLSDLDPSYDLPADERYMASIKGAVPKYSGLLKRGLSDSLALLATFGDEFSSQLGGYKPSGHIRIWVRELFDANKEVKFWYSLGSCMQLIAEAAPEEFISAVEVATLNEKPILLGLFEEEDPAALGGGCYHSNLLWSLEQLSWNKQYFAKTSLCLARLAEFDPGGRWNNRPSSSLVDIYLGWINNTSISHKERIQVLDKLLIPQYPEVAWRLMLSLLIKSSGGVTTGISKPKYQDWSKNIERSTTIQDYHDYVGSIVDLLFREIGYDKDARLSDLISNFNSYTETQQQKIIDKLLNQNVDLISNDARDKILNQLRATLSHHREFPESEWTWPTKLLDKLEKVYYHFDYADTVKASVFLFNDHWPKFINPVNRKEGGHEERDDLIQNSRIKIIETLYKEGGNDALKQLILTSSCPEIAGFSTYKSSISNEVLNTVFKWLSESGKYVVFSERYFSVLAHENMNHAVDIFKNNVTWDAEMKSRFLLCFPRNKETFSLVDGLDQAGQSLYWTKLNRYFVSDKDSGLVPIIAAKFLEYERPLAALDAISQVLDNSDVSSLDGNLVESILIKIAFEPKDLNSPSTQINQYKIVKAIEFIQNYSSIKVENIRQLEWIYLPFFRFSGVQPRYLFKYVTENPDFYAQLVSWVFIGNDDIEEKDDELSQEKLQQRAETAWELLNTLSMLPGVTEEDIDKDILNSWVDVVRTICKDSGRTSIGDSQIGTLLARSKVENDSIWPHESVRDVLERIKSEDVENGLVCGRINIRGVTSRHPYAGGSQERELAFSYQNDAEKIQLLWPRTAGVLRSIAKHYERQADREDQSVEIGQY